MQQLDFKQIPLKNIQMDPDQPRKHFNPASLEEMAQSIEQHGILEPVIVRPTKSKNKDQYMLVVGERRYRGSELAKKETIDAIVRNYTDQEAREVQITENLQRENMNAMEEAVAYQALTKKGGYTVDRLAARLGKRTDYIRQCLRYCELTLLWQEVMYASKLRLTDANLLCRFGEDQQVEFYNQYVPKGWETLPEGWMVPPMQLVEKTKNLNVAPFKTEDPDLYQKMGACGQCKYNSAVSQLVFPGEENQRICSNPACYYIKERNSHLQKLEEATKNNVLLIAGGAYSQPTIQQIKKVEATGKPVLHHHDYEILTEPELLPIEKYEKQYAAKTKDKPKEEVEALYADYVQEIENKQAEYNFKKSRAKQAFVVGGDYGVKTGEMVEVYVPQPEPEAIVQQQQMEEEIATLQRQKTKAIEQANQDFLKDLAGALRLAPAYWENEKALELKDCLAMLQVLTDLEETYDQQLAEEMRIEWGSPQVKTEDLLTSIMSTSKTGFLYKWLRRLTLSKITEFDITNAGGISLRLLAERYIPRELEDLQKLYKAKQKEIIDSTNEKIAALQQTEMLVEEDPESAVPGDDLPIVVALKKGLKVLSENVEA